jgi:hypothetical protein
VKKPKTNRHAHMICLSLILRNSWCRGGQEDTEVLRVSAFEPRTKLERFVWIGLWISGQFSGQ